MQDGCKVYMDFYMASNGSCFIVTWTIFKNHLLKVSLTQNRETMAFRTLTTVDLIYFFMCEDPHILKCIEITSGGGFGHIRLHTTFEGLRPHYMIWRCVRTAFGHFLLGSHNFMVTALGSRGKYP
jgi:hypothetical protein